MIENTQGVYEKEMNNGGRFQKELASLTMKSGFKTIVETGYGVSTVFFLYAMKHTLDMEDAMLYSIDPNPWYANEIVSPQLKHIKEKSIPALKDLFLKTGAWDLFLHDGNHDILCQTYEYEFAWACLKVGGVLASDDYTWGGHNAWGKFLLRHNLTAIKLGDVEFVMKQDGNVLSSKQAEDFHTETFLFAQAEEKNWLEAGNKNSEAFQ